MQKPDTHHSASGQQEIWLPRLRRMPSPNRDARPPAARVELVVVHNISLPPGEFGSDMVVELFCNTLDCSRHPALLDLAGLSVSAHLFVDRKGKATQFVPLEQRAWHAGVSDWRGRTGCNDFAIGIELEGTDDRPYTAKQYRRLVSLLGAIRALYPAIGLESIVGHNEIAPGRKTDPGSVFDWQRVLNELS